LAELTEPIKEAVVTLLARFVSPADVVVAIREEFDGHDITVRQVIGYDPTRAAFDAGEKWRVHFDLVRKAYIEDAAAVPIGNQSFRLNELLKLYEKASRQKNYKLAAEILEQASKESGGVFTNQRHIDVDDKRARARGLSETERREMLAGVLDEARSRRQDEGSTATQ
jgi:hypothetical protein